MSSVWVVEDMCSQIWLSPELYAYSAPLAICSMMAHTPFHCESWCQALLPDPLKSFPLPPAPFPEAPILHT